MAYGSVVGYRMDKKTAETLAESLNVLIKSETNIERCEDWSKMIVERYGLYGPIGN